MKPRFKNILTAASMFIGAVSYSQAASETWSATAASGAWETGTNWVSGSTPGATTGTTNGDIATFTGASTTQVIDVDAGRNVLGVTFASNNTYTLQGSTLLLSSGGTILSNGSAGDERINAPLQIQGDGGNYSIQLDTPGTNRELIIATGGITGVSTIGNNTALTLTGSSTGANNISAAIGDGVGGGTLSLVKDGVGLWVLTSGGLNTYSGGTTVTAGTLRVDNSGNTSGNLSTGAVTMNGGTLRLQSSSGATVNNALATTANGGTISFRGNSFFNPPAITGSGTLTLTSDSGVTVSTNSYQGFTGSLVFGGETGTTFFRFVSAFDDNSLQFAAVHIGAAGQFTRNYGTNGTNTSKIGALSGDAGSSLGGSAAGAGTFVFEIGSRNEPSAFAGIITDGGTKTGLTKVGTETLTLTGANTYTGNTTVSAGTLSVTTPYLADASTVSVANVGGSAVLNLDFSGGDFVTTFLIDGAPQADGVYGAPGSVLPIIATPAISGPGLLYVNTPLPSNDYDTWAAIYAPADLTDTAGDNDNDGLTNQQEFAYGLSPVDGSSVNPILVQLDKSAGTFTYQRRSTTGLNYTVLTSPDLITWTPNTPTGEALTPVGDNESVAVTLSGLPLPGKFFVRVAASE